MEVKKYYVGLDIGTDSVGYAVTDEEYNLRKFKGEPMWGVHLFEEAELNSKRRAFRTARRRLDRRQARVKLVREIFAREIAKVDEGFYRRIDESALWREDAQDAYCIFSDSNFTDADYYKRYPTIHHLICDLMNNKEPHDVRLVYLACAWLVAHRGHFLNDISKDNIEDVLHIDSNYRNLMNIFEGAVPWECKPEEFGDVLKKKLGITAKYKSLCLLLFGTPKAPKTERIEDEKFYSTEHMLKLLCGSTVAPKDLFANPEYADVSSFSLDRSDEDLSQILISLGDDAELILRLKALYDWAILADILEGATYISEKKVAIYEQHKKDLRLLKRMVRAYAPKSYRDVFRDEGKSGYASYSKSGKSTEFCKYLRGIFKGVSPSESDAEDFKLLSEKLQSDSLCPRQVTSDNRVIPYQVYWRELHKILNTATAYLPFLADKDADGYITADKLLSVMEFRIPYFVGPLNRASTFSWFERKADSTGRILPWNFDEQIDLERSEQAFINRMTNSCTYLPYADVLPKCSLLHEKFQLLNEINNLRVHGQKIPVSLKQKLFLELFGTRKKVTVKALKNYLLQNGAYQESDLDTLSGIDETVKSSLGSHFAFRRLLSSGQLSEPDAEQIIRRSTYTEDKSRFASWVRKEFPHLSEDDKKYISSLKFKDFARLSKELLCDLYGTEADSGTGEAVSIIDRMWNENLNLMEILSERYTYRAELQAEVENYYREHPKSIDARMEEMRLSNAVKRPIIRALDIISDVVKVSGSAPKKIFIEMARGGKKENKGKRTKSRFDQLKELYAKCELEDARELDARLDAMGDDRDSRLQADKLFLYYLQLGRSMYSGEPIDIEHLADKTYDIDHIYPQSKVKDDSVLNNKVLVLSSENGAKGDKYPICADIRHKMESWWRLLLDGGFITTEKYKRLTRYIPFDEDEEWGFINRQLVETRQSTKATATLLKEIYPETEIVYVKAGLVAEFRQEFDMVKCRVVNDLHHAKDAYLNIVVGNVYSEQFTRQWFLQHRDTYNLKVSTLFSRRVTVGERVIWNGGESLGKIKNTIYNKNSIHLTRYAFCRNGGLFDQQPKSSDEGVIPRKQGMPVKKYGGYVRTTASFFIFAKYQTAKMTDIMLVPVELLVRGKFLRNDEFALEYIRDAISGIINKQVDSVSFPLGKRCIKINTVLEFDGTRMCVAGKSNGGAAIVPSMLMPLIVGYKWERYIKYLERFVEKKEENPRMVYSEKYDNISEEENSKLYDLLLSKLESSPYDKRPNNPAKTLRCGRDKFVSADICDQAKCLLEILSVFGRSSGGCDLETVGGKGRAGACRINASFSNWRKSYTDVRIIDQTASGLYERRSENLLSLL
ncbi:MAG: type II CRISPR RNA-guided endonuclease Cas9 [Clostridia bacterium]|nr:type II CRISPR RNA-guided endonuclease Cas9 [Clostridia bacterium]